MILKTNKRHLGLFGIDSATFAIVYALSIFMEHLSNFRMDHDYPTVNVMKYVWNFLLFYSVVFIARYVGKVYRNVWKYADSMVYLELIIIDAVGGAVALLISRLIPQTAVGGWYSVAMMAMFACASLALRFAYQQYDKHISRVASAYNGQRIPVAIVGAGHVGALLATELRRHASSRYQPVCFIDNNPDKSFARLHGIPVFDDGEEIFNKLTRLCVQEIFIAIPDLDADKSKELFDYYMQSGCKVKLYDFNYNTDVVKADREKRVLREFKIEDLLFRKSIIVTDTSTLDYYKGKTILITGGGGSIGSEIVRQLAACEPKRLVVVDIYENNAYEIQQELVRKYGKELDLVVEIASVRDKTRLDAIFNYHRPQVVFHAAAHKHVPLMERSSCEAIKNNCFGTYNTANAAEKYGVEKFILISTDKAVNPTNVMGASKRMCEMIIQCRNDSKTAFCAVRFGNVLGSNGSVIPLFKKQISDGGPVTITDKRIQRYFMLIPEAAGLVMVAGAKAVRGELFVLDMGDPVKIYDLATNMIKLSGLIPEVDIEIKEIGLRPGEKLYEELLIKTENLDKTDNDLIFIETDKPLSREEVEDKLNVLAKAVKDAENEVASDSIAAAMKSVIPTFFSPEEVNKDFTSDTQKCRENVTVNV